MPSFPPAQIERFKRDAKRLVRTTDLTHSQALDQIAVANGFANWSLLMKHCDAGPRPAIGRARPPHRFVRTTEQMRLALRKVPILPDPYAKPRVEAARSLVDDLTEEFVSAKNVVDFAVEYMTCLLTVPRFKVQSASKVNWEMRSWLPYYWESISDGRFIVVNRSYKPAGQVSKDWVNYEAYPQLQARMDTDDLKSFTAMGSKDGYLFNDGCPPWWSRADAEDYLKRLRVLQQVLSR